MSSEVIESFNEIYDDPNNYDSNGELIPDALEKISKLNFSLLNIDDIEVIENAEKLPDELALSILKRWMYNQNSVLSNIRGNLIYKSKIPSETFREFIEAMKCPSKECNYVVEDILLKISTGGGIDEPSCLIDFEKSSNGLIGFDQIKSSNYNNSSSIVNLFDFKLDTFYVSAPLENSYFTITLPPFLKVRLTSYKMISPPDTSDRTAVGGIKSWKIVGFNQKNEKIDLDTRINNEDLRKPSAVARFDVKPNDFYFRNFQVINTGLNHQNNQSIILAGFDISGTLLIEND